MMRLLLTIVAVMLSLTGTAAANPPGSDAAALLRKLQASPAARTYPEEFASLADTIATAEKMQQEGDKSGAAQLFALALLKGRLLLDRTTPAPPPAAVAAPPLFRQLSSVAKSPPDAPQEPQAQQASPSPPPADDTMAAETDPYRNVSARIVGGKGVYSVKRRESLRLVASRLGVRLRDLARMNRLKTDAIVTAGQRLRYNNRRIVPKMLRNGIVVNIPDRNLYLFRNGRFLANYPVAVGMAKKGETTSWRTPTGRFRVIDKKENPTWRIPLSIQKEMEENGEEVVDSVPPGPKNPLGKYALRTSLDGILIHSTTRPASINSFSSHGCIRVMPEHMERLFRSVTIPADGEIIYQPVKVEVTATGKVFLEVNSDSYEKFADLSAEVLKVLKKHHAAGRVSWQKVQQLINEKSGIAEDVTLAAIPD
jgi:lipoprotein-anchoring transpeptidase ErfK/SrfK